MVAIAGTMIWGSTFQEQRPHVLVNSVPQGSLIGIGVLEILFPGEIAGVEATWLPRNRSFALAGSGFWSLGAPDSFLGRQTVKSGILTALGMPALHPEESQHTICC